MENVETIVIITGAIIALVAESVPMGWFEKAPANMKRLYMLLAVSVATAAIMGLGCFDLLPAVGCVPRADVLTVFGLAIQAFMANQAAHLLNPMRKD